jgi:hypothetical protein
MGRGRKIIVSMGFAKDCYNSVDFRPVKTTGLRIVAKLRKRKSGGIIEWKVN